MDLPVDPVVVTGSDPTDDDHDEKPPMYSIDGQLIPTTPQRNDRYARHAMYVADDYSLDT